MHPSCRTLVMAGGEYEDQDVTPTEQSPTRLKGSHEVCRLVFLANRPALPMEKQIYMAKAVGSRTTPKFPFGNDQNSRAKHKTGR